LGFVAALQFLTIFPVRLKVSANALRRSIAYFPLVGMLIGGILYGLDRLFTMAFPVILVNILLVIALAAMTRALHLDGFIDTCDGLAGGHSPEERLTIMRDSRVGGFGVIGGCLLILLQYVALTVMPAEQRMAALLLMPTIARWTMVYAVFTFPYARERGMGKIFQEGTKWPWLVIATAITLASCLGLMWLRGLAVMAAAMLVALLVANWLSRKLGGLTGDTYGAINELVEVSVLILIPLITWSYAI
jgi:adenosylcobinamide-GDP ribazoletransferase